MKLLKLRLRKNRLHEKCIPIILTILLGMDFCFANAQRVDSLKSLLVNSNGGSLCEIYHQIAYELIDVDSKAALDYASKSLGCADELDDTLQFVRAARLKAIAFRRLGELDSSNKIALAVLPIARAKSYYQELTQILHGLAIAYLYKAKFDESLRYSFESLDIRKKHGMLKDVGFSLGNIGFVYYKLADYDKALIYNSEALDAFKEAGIDDNYTFKLLFNIALCYAYSNKPEKANTCIDEVLSLCKQDCPVEVVQNASFCRGVIAVNQNDIANAKRHFQLSYSKSVELGDERLELDNIVYLSRLYLETGDITRAEGYLQMAETLIHKGIPYSMEQMKVYSEFAVLFERRGDYRKVAHFLQRHMALKDSIYDDEVTTQLMRIEAEHIEKEKNAKIETQSKMLELNAKVISRQKIATGFATTTALLLVGVVILSVRSIRDKRRKNRDLEGRVKKRTAELEAIVRQSQISLAENAVWMQKVVCSVRHTANTVNGLSSLVNIDPASSEKCIGLIGYEMTQLLTHISSCMLKSEERARNLRGIE